MAEQRPGNSQFDGPPESFANPDSESARDAGEGARRFPALAGLGLRRTPRHVPFVQSLTNADCGAACLAMVLAYHGKAVRLDDVRNATGTNRDGVDALSIVNAGRLFGLRGRGVRVELDELAYLGRGAILHWEFAHFVVLDRVGRRHVDVVDPSYGPRRVPLAEFRKAFTGVALEFEQADDFEPAAAESGGVWRYFRRVLAQPGVLAQVIITSLLIQALLLVTPILTGALVDRVLPREDYRLLLVLAGGVGLTALFHFLALLVRSLLLLHLRTHLDVRMMLGFLEHLVSLPYDFFQRRATGDLMMRLSSNTTMRELLTSTTMSAFLDGSLVALYLFLLVVLDLRMALAVLALAAVKFVVFGLSRRVYRTLMAKDLAAQSRSEAYLVELLSGIETLKSLGAERRAVEHWSHLFVDQLNVSLQRGRVSALVDALMGMLQMASPLVILVYGATHVLNGRLSLGEMLALTALGTGALAPISALIAAALSLQLLRSYVERIDDVLGHPPEQDERRVRQAATLRGGLTLERVWFSYGPLAAPAVKDVSIEIAPGQNVAIVGRSGAGKSTLARLLLALHKPQRGRICYDQLDLSTLDVRSVRRRMGIVPQEPYLFGGSVRENILLGNPGLPLEAAIEAAKAACIHDDILQTPMGYDTLIGNGGSDLSAGQRQRIAIARAIVHKPAFLLMDEATSALDAVNERQVQQNLERLSCTRIVIAHRLSTVMKADLILVMEAGEIVERGTHRALMDRQCVYYQLVSSQLATG